VNVPFAEMWKTSASHVLAAAIKFLGIIPVHWFLAEIVRIRTSLLATVARSM